MQGAVTDGNSGIKQYGVPRRPRSDSTARRRRPGGHQPGAALRGLPQLYPVVVSNSATNGNMHGQELTVTQYYSNAKLSWHTLR